MLHRIRFGRRLGSSRRLVAMMSSLFSRRFGRRNRAPAVARARYDRRRNSKGLTGWVSTVSNSISGVADQTTMLTTSMIRSGLSSIASLEQLEPRAMRAGADFNHDSAGTLAIWLDEPDEQIQIWSTDGSGRVTVTSNKAGLVFDSTLLNDRGNPDASVDFTTVIPDKIQVYEEQLFPLSGSLGVAPGAGNGVYEVSQFQANNKTANFGGSGYTSQPAVTMDRQNDGSFATYRESAGATAWLGISDITGTATGTGIPTTGTAIGTIEQLGTNGGATATFNYDYATNAITGISATNRAGSSVAPRGFNNLNNVRISLGGFGVVGGLSATGYVDFIDVTNDGDGYFADVTATFSGGGGTGALLFLDLDPANTGTFGNESSTGVGTNTGAIFRPVSGTGAANPIRQNIYVGSSQVGAGLYNTSGSQINTTFSFISTSLDFVTVNTPIITTDGDFILEDVLTYTQNEDVTVPAGDFTISEHNMGLGTEVIISGDVTTSGAFDIFTGNTVTFDAGQVTAGGDLEIGWTGASRTASITATGRGFEGRSVAFDANLIDLTLSTGQKIEATKTDIAMTSPGAITIEGSGQVLADDSLQIIGIPGGASDITIEASLVKGNVEAEIVSTTGFVDVKAAVTSDSYVRIASDVSTVNVSKPVSSGGSAYLQSEGDMTIDDTVSAATNLALISNDQILGIGRPEADRLTIVATKATGITLNTSVNVVSATTDGSLEISNDKSLTTGLISLLNGGDLTIGTTGETSDLTLSTLTHSGGDLTLTAGRDLTVVTFVSSTGNVSLEAVEGGITATQLSTPEALRATAKQGIDLSGSVNASTFALLTEVGDISLRAPQFSKGNVTIAEAKTTSGNISLFTTSGNLVLDGDIVTSTDRVVSLTAAEDIITTSDTNLTAGTVNYLADDSSPTNFLAGTLGQATFHTIGAELRDAGAALTVTQPGSLNVAQAITKNGDISISSTGGNLSIIGKIEAGTGDIVLSAVAGSISSTANVSGAALDIVAQNSSSLERAGGVGGLQIDAINATITGTGESLSIDSSGDLVIGAGGIKVEGGLIDITLDNGNLSRGGDLNATTSGQVRINVGTSTIDDEGVIETGLLDWTAASAPNPANLTYSSLRANQTIAGDLSVSVADDLVIEAIGVEDGNVSVTTKTGNLSVNGDIASRQNSAVFEVSLSAANGSITSDPSAKVTAGNLAVTANGSVVLQTDVNQLTAAVANGSIVITEDDGLAVSAGGVLAGQNVTLTVLNGDLDLDGPITAGAAADNFVNLTVPNGAINGTGILTVTKGALLWTAVSQPDPAITNAWSYTDLAAHVTGPGNPLTIPVSSDLNLLSASTHSGAIDISLSGSNLTVSGDVTAGTDTRQNLHITNAANVTVGANAVLSASYLNISAAGDVDVTVNVAEMEIEGDNIDVIATSSVELVGRKLGPGRGIDATGNVTMNVTGDLVVNAPFSAVGNNVNITTTGGLTGTSNVTSQNLGITAGSDVELNVAIQSLTANVTGDLTITEIDLVASNLAVGAAGVSATGDVSLTLTQIGGELTGVGAINASGDVILDVTAGIDLPGASQVSGTELSIAAGNHVTIGTNVVRLTANLPGNPDDPLLPTNLTINEFDDLEIAAGGVSVTGAINITAGGNITGSGSVSGQFLSGIPSNVALTSTAGSIDLSGAGQVSADSLNVTAATGMTLGTNVASISANVTGVGDMVINEVDDLVVNLAETSNGSISITAGGDIGGVGAVTAGGQQQVSIAAGGEVNLSDAAGQVTGSRLDLTAGDGAVVQSNVSQVTAAVTGDLNLTNDSDLEIVAPGIVTVDGDLLLTVNGDLTGNTAITANGGQGNVGITANDVIFEAASLISADQLNLATLNATVNTDIDEVVGVVSGSLTLTETDGLELGAAGLVVNGTANVTVSAGDLGGNGVLNATGNSVVLNVAGSININGSTEQVVAENLTALAGGSIAMNVNVDDLAATAAGGDLVIIEADGFNVSATLPQGDGGLLALGNSISVQSGGNVTGDGDVVGNDVTITADGITLENGTIEATAVDLQTATGNATVTTNVATLVADVAGDLTVVETDDLQIGAADGDAVSAANISITISDAGNLTSVANGNLNATGQIDIDLQGSGGGSVDLTDGVVRAVELNVTTANGAIFLNTEVDNLTAFASEEGGIAVTEADDLRVDGVISTDANIAITLASGNLAVDSEGVIAGQLNEVSLNVSGGSINSVDDSSPGNLGIITGRRLVFTAQNASSFNTSVSEITGEVTGANQDLTIYEQDGAITGVVNMPIDGLTIGDAGLRSNGGNITVTVAGSANVSGGNLTLNGVISAAGTNSTSNVDITVEDGAITSTTAADFIEANVATITAANDSKIETRVSTIEANIAGDLILNEHNDINGNITAGVLTLTTGNAALNEAGSANLGTTIDTLTANVSGDLTIDETDDLQIGVDSFGLADNLADPFFSDPANNPVRDLINFPQNVVFNSATSVLTTNNGSIDITAGGNITGNGSVIAGGGTANITLNAGADIVLNRTGQLQGDLLNVTAGGDADLGTDVDSLTGNITGNLVVSEVNDLVIAAGDVVTVNGDISITTVNNLSGAGFINAASGNANVSLNVTGVGDINLSSVPGQIGADALDVTTANGSATLNTAVDTIVADVAGELVVNEQDDLAIGTNVVTSGGNIAITAGGNITGVGNIIASNGADDVSLNAAQDITLATTNGQVVADRLDVVAANATINTRVDRLSASVTNNLTITEEDDLLIDAAGVSAGNVSITTLDGNLTGGNTQGGGQIVAVNDVVLNVNSTTTVFVDNLSDPFFSDPANNPVRDLINFPQNAVVNLNGMINLTNGGVVSSPNFAAVTAGGTLDVTSNGNAVIDTEVQTLVSDVTGSLTINENSSISMGANVLAGDTLSITANGTINGTGYVNASTVVLESTNANVVLNAILGQINAEALRVEAATDSYLNTSVTSIDGDVGANLTIIEKDGLAIGPGRLIVGGDLTVQLLSGDLTGGGAVDATGNVSLNVVTGGITLNATFGQVEADSLSIRAQNDVRVNTEVDELAANVTGLGNSLTVNEVDALIIAAEHVVTNDGDISITTGGPLTITGDINTTANVTLDIGGTITGLGEIVADELDISADGSVTINTTVTSLATDITGDLTVEETDDLVVDGIQATGDISINLATGDLTGNGILAAGGDITLNTSGGAIDLDAVAGQISGNNLSLTAQNSSSVNTKVSGITANITTVGETLTINEVDDLEIIVPGLATDAGDISVTVGGDLEITGGINVIPPNANVTLNVTGGITGAGLITADRLTVVAGESATVTTNIAEIDASITGSLVVNEADDLEIVAVSATEDVTLNVIGNLSGAGNIAAGDDVTLISGGSIEVGGTISGDLLTFSAQNSSVLNTSVNAITGVITTAGETLEINEVDALDIAAGGVTVQDGQINITTGGSLRLLGDIDALTTGDVTLDIGGGATSVGGEVKAVNLNLTAVLTSSLETSIDNLTATITGLSSQDLIIDESNGLVVDSIQTTGGDATVRLDAGDLDIRGNITAGDVTLEATAGSVSTSTGQVIGDDLTVTAEKSSFLNTSVSTLTGTVTGAGETLVINELDTLTIASGGVSTNNGDITLNIGGLGADPRELAMVGDVDAGTGDITLLARRSAGSGVFSADNLSFTLNSTSSLQTNVTTISGNLTDGAAVLQVFEADDLQIGSDNVAALGAKAYIGIETGGNLTGPGSIVGENATVVIDSVGDIALDGRIDVESGGFVTLTAGGEISMNDPVQIEARRLTLTSVGDADVGTNISELSATVTGPSSTLTVSEYDGLTILKNTAITNNGLITISAGEQDFGDLNIRGPVDAGNNDVVLINKRGNITGLGTITGRNLDIQVGNGSASVLTNVDGLTANLSTVGESLSVQEQDGLTILSGNVVTNDGDILLAIAAGNLTGDGSIDAGTGNVTLSVPAGSVLINPGAQIIANILDVDAAGGAVLETNVENLSVDLTGSGAAVTVNEANDLVIDGIETNNGDVSVTAAGSINSTGGINAGTGDVVLSAGNGINIAGGSTVVGDDLDVTAGTNANISSDVNTLHGTVGGTLEVTETNGLTIPPSGITADNLTINVLSGDLDGTGRLAINQSVNLLAGNGSITFNSLVGQIEGTDLNVSASTSADIRTDVGSIVSNQTGSLTVEEQDGLDIGAAGIDTSAGNGDVSITLLRGDLTGNGINAGEGNITIDTKRGGVNLTGGVVSGNSLLLTAYRGPVNLTTDLDRIDATILRNGDLTISEADDLIVEQARVNRGGSVSINITGAGNLTVTGDVRATGRTGNVTLTTNNGNLTLGPDGTISTRATLDLSGINGSITIEPGTSSRRITTGRRDGSVVMAPGQTVDWQLDYANPTETSFRTVIDNINRFAGNSSIDVQENTTISLTRSLPAFRNSVVISGNNMLTLSAPAGANRVNGLTFRADGSTIDGVIFENFGRTAVTLIGGRDALGATEMTASNLTVNNSQMAVRAINFFGAGSSLLDSNIDGAGRSRSFGVMLAKARGFTVTLNTISDVNIGIQISSRSNNTLISKNTISGQSLTNGYGISILRATGSLAEPVEIRENEIDNFLYGFFASGFCTFTTVSNNNFDTDGSGGSNGSEISLQNQYNVSRSRNLTVVV